MANGASALKKINARVKKLAKRFPKKKRSTLQKQAGKEYREGKLKRRKRPAAKKVKRRKVRRLHKVAKVAGVRRVRKVARRRRRKATARPKVVIRTRTKTVRVGRRVGASSSKLMPVLAIGAALVAGYLLLKPRPAPVLITTGNTVRDSQAANIIAYAQAAGATATAITKLIQAINAGNDSQVAALQTAVSSNTVNLQDDSAVQSLLNQNQSYGGLAGTSRVMGY